MSSLIRFVPELHLGLCSQTVSILINRENLDVSVQTELQLQLLEEQSRGITIQILVLRHCHVEKSIIKVTLYVDDSKIM